MAKLGKFLVFFSYKSFQAPLSFEWMNGTNPTVAFLSDFLNSWICRSIITYLSRGEYFTNWRAGGVKRGSQAAIWGWKSAGPVYAHITAVSPPRPLHLSLLHPPGLGWQIHKYTNTHHSTPCVSQFSGVEQWVLLNCISEILEVYFSGSRSVFLRPCKLYF